MRTLGLLALLVAATTLAACAGAPGTPASTPSPAPSATPASPVGVWRLDRLGGAGVLPGAAVTATFGADGSLTGTAGCNRFTGRYEFSSGSLTVAEPIATTMMACDEARMTLEATFLAALQGAQSFTRADETLTVTGSADDLVFVAEAQDLAGTEWQVTAYNTGTAVTGVVQGSAPTVTFSADGSIGGSGGCNTFSGAWSATDGQLQISSLASTRMACAEPAGVMEQEAALLAALETAATYGIEGGVLSIRTTDGATAAQLTRS